MQSEAYLEYASDVTVAPRARWRGIVLIQVIQGILVVGTTGVIFRTLEGVMAGMVGWFAIGCLQLMILRPIVEPRIGTQFRKSWGYWMSASVCGLFAGMLVCLVLGMAGDLLWFIDILPSETGGKGSMSEGSALGVGVAVVIVLLTSWGTMTPLLVMFMKNRPAESALCRIVCSLFLGTIVEALSAVGIMVMIRNRSDCVCATFSGLALAVSFAVGFVVFGPGVLLLVLWRRSRVRPGGMCLACGADLNGLGYPARCLVCGVGWRGK